VALGERGVQIDTKAGAKKAQAVRKESEEEISEWASEHKPWLDAITAAFDDAIVVGDSTQPVYTGNHIYEAPQPRSWFNSATGYGTLGYGLPGAIGAKIAAPDRPVICITGDGGILFTIGELASAVEAKAGIAILLWNNQGYKTISDNMVADQIAPVGCIEYTPDFLAIARGFGCEAEHVDTPEALTQALKTAHKRDIPTLIEVQG